MNICNQHLSLYLNTNLVSSHYFYRINVNKVTVTYSPNAIIKFLATENKKTTHTITQTPHSCSTPPMEHMNKYPHRDPQTHTHKCLRLPLLHLRPAGCVRVKRPYCISLVSFICWDNLQKGWPGDASVTTTSSSIRTPATEPLEGILVSPPEYKFLRNRKRSRMFGSEMAVTGWVGATKLTLCVTIHL